MERGVTLLVPCEFVVVLELVFVTGCLSVLVLVCISGLLLLLFCELVAKGLGALLSTALLFIKGVAEEPASVWRFIFALVIVVCACEVEIGIGVCGVNI